MATAANTSTTPSQPSKPRSRFNMVNVSHANCELWVVNSRRRSHKSSRRTTSACCRQLAIRNSQLDIHSPAPPLRINRLRGEEEAERDEAEVIDDVLRVHDAAREVLEVLRD